MTVVGLVYLVREEYDFDGIVYLTLRARTFYIILMVNANHWGFEGLTITLYDINEACSS